MIVETSVKVKLTQEEEECLKKANEIIDKIYMSTQEFSCEIDFEGDIDWVLDEMQATIRNII